MSKSRKPNYDIEYADKSRSWVVNRAKLYYRKQKLLELLEEIDNLEKIAIECKKREKLSKY